MEQVSLSLAFFWECRINFEKIFTLRENCPVIKQILTELEMLDEEGMLSQWVDSLPLTEDELQQLRRFLDRCANPQDRFMAL